MKSISQIAAELGREPGVAHTRRRTREYPDPARQEDHDYRQAYGTKGRRPFGRGLRAAFYAYLPESPIGPHVTREDAANYVQKIQTVIEMQRWPKHERERLRVLLRRWERRARGEDGRFNARVPVGVSNKTRPQTVGDCILNIQRMLRESLGHAPQNPGTRFVADAKWPLGRPV